MYVQFPLQMGERVISIIYLDEKAYTRDVVSEERERQREREQCQHSSIPVNGKLNAP